MSDEVEAEELASKAINETSLEEADVAETTAVEDKDTVTEVLQVEGVNAEETYSLADEIATETQLTSTEEATKTINKDDSNTFEKDEQAVDEAIEVQLQTEAPKIPEKTAVKQQQQQQQQQPTMHVNDQVDDDDDVSAKAAVTLAAVAAAATANHTSPAEAAREARLAAQSFIATDQHHNSNAETAITAAVPVVSVRLAAVQAVLDERNALPNSTIYQAMMKRKKHVDNVHEHNHHHNPSLLQHLLLLEHFRCMDNGSISSSSASLSDATARSHLSPPGSCTRSENAEDTDEDDDDGFVSKAATVRDQEMAKQAHDKLVLLLKKLETAHECLREQAMRGVSVAARKADDTEKLELFATDQNGDDDIDSDTEDFETPIVVPDLLPPCTSKNGDATLAFFKACAGAGQLQSYSADMPDATESKHGSPKVTDASNSPVDQKVDDVLPVVESNSDTAGSSSNTSSNHNQAASSFLGNLLKRTTASVPATVNAAANANKTTNASSFTNLLLKRGNRAKSMGFGGNLDEDNYSQSEMEGNSHRSRRQSVGANTLNSLPDDSYLVRIDREMLGLTVENVLERTVVRTVLAGGPAKQAGAKVGSLILQVGTVSTAHLTHFETIDELRQSQRPLNLVLRHLSDDSLRRAREEMGRLIKGSGFGAIIDAQNSVQQHGSGGASSGNSGMGGTQHGENHGETTPHGTDGRQLIGADLRIDAYTNLLRRRFQESRVNMNSKKDEAIARAGEKLVWILTLFVIGLEKEAARLRSLIDLDEETYTTAPIEDTIPSPPASPRRQHSQFSRTAKDYIDAANSVSKVLLDFTKKRLDPNTSSPQKSRAAGFLQHSLEAGGGTVRRRGHKGPPPPPAINRATSKSNSNPLDKPLMQIGDVLQRTRTFLADPSSPPAALLRGEIISLLCDILDIDTDMELAEEESATAIAGGSAAKAGMINDLGSAGSLLKVIVLNCPIMRSSCCEVVSGQYKRELDPETVNELKQRFGPRATFTTADLHRLHAGNRFLSVVHRLAASRSTSARITACSLGPVLWGHLDFPHQLQLRGVITRALHDVEVIVRKSTATVLHEIAELVFDRRAVPWLVLMCERAMTDPEPQLRSAAMTLTWHLAEHLPNAFLGDASQGSRFLRRLPNREDPIFADVYLLQCKLLPVATRLAEDRSPSVRIAVAAQCDRLCDALGDHWSSVIIDVLLALLSDSDDRVRCEAVSCVPRLAEIVMLSVHPGEVASSEMSVLEALIPASIKLQKDSSASVRVALAAAAGELLTLLVSIQARVDNLATENGPISERVVVTGAEEPPKKYKRHVDDRLIPLVQTLLNDKDPEVTSAALRAVTNATRNSVQTQHHRRNMSVASVDDDISLSSFQSHQSDNKPVFSPVLSEKQVLRLLPTLTELADSRQWRVRQSAVEIVPALLGCTQKLETRTEISKLCVRLMCDQVDAVRNTAAECLCMGGSSLGSHGEDASAEWFTSIVVPTIRNCAVHTQSKQRLLCLKMIEVMLLNGAFPARWKGEDSERMADSPLRELAGIAMSLTGDHIANVRLNVGRVLENVLRVFEDDDLTFISEVLVQQMDAERNGDQDQDVLFFAQRCIARAKAIIEERRSPLQRDDSPANIFD
ncbi:hypothetical protein MPSEU_000021900 [Mayamaea pseudoterrestris]|nr:hypothetical protein MPSEU_000021900 [Mayamaea pseudoterrestris]